MRIIVAGAGEVGTHLAGMLTKEGHDIVIIDPDEEKLRNILARIDVLTINGSATSFSTLTEARIEDAQLFIAVAHDEEVNLLSCIIAKKLGAKKTIARVDTGEFLDEEKKAYFNKLGIDSLICPEKLASGEIVGLLKQVGTSEVFDFSGGKLSLYVVKLDEGAPVINKSLSEIAQHEEAFHFTAVAITREGTGTIIPRGTDRFLVNDLIYIITDQQGIPFVLKYSGKERFDIHNIMILGGSRIGLKTALTLEKHLNIKIIEKDKDRCEKLVDFFNDTLVINGDGTNINLLIEEGIKRMDAFIAVTGNSETNILSCMLAKKFGVKKTIAEIENIDYIDLAENIGIDTIINKKLITASRIFQYTMRAEVNSIKCLTGADAELMEVVAKPGSKITSGTIREVVFPENALVGGIVRGNKGIIAKGSIRIEPYDKVIVFALPDAISKVQEFFE